MSIIEKRAANPIATHQNSSRLSVYTKNTGKSRENLSKSASHTREKLESGIWQVICLLQGEDLSQGEKSQGWQLFDSCLRKYLDVIQEEGAA